MVLPGDVDDPHTPSGGNVYDRRVCRGLAELGWRVGRVGVDGAWPRPGPDGRAALDRALGGLPDGATVLLDGLVACGVPEIVVPHARRLRTAVLVHLPLAAETGLTPVEAAELDRLERDTLHAAALIVATSPQAARGLAERHGLDPDRVGVAAPGVDPAPLAPGTDGASRLLCVASVTPRKGHDVLVRALATLRDLPWNCVCVGPLGRDHEVIATGDLADAVRLADPPGRDDGYAARERGTIDVGDLDDRVRLTGPLGREEGYAARDRGMIDAGGLADGVRLVDPPGREGGYAARIREMIAAGGLADRVRLVGPLSGEPLEAEYAAADLLVLPSRAETYGMVVTEALARGIPVLTTTADALPETLGRAPDGSVPGLLVPPDDPAALADALRRWLINPVLRVKIRTSARGRRGMLHGWSETSRHLAELLDRLQR